MDKKIKNEVEEAVARAKEDPHSLMRTNFGQIFMQNEQIPPRGTINLQ